MIEFDVKKEMESAITRAEKKLGEILNPGDERRIVIETVIAAMAAAVQRADAIAKGQLLRTAWGSFLDDLGEPFDVKRFDASPAAVTMRFSISVPVGGKVTIPQGARTTADGVLMFATQQTATLDHNASYVDMRCVCTTPGTIGNGIAPGQIKILVDPVKYITSIANVDMSTGGADQESDNDFRARVRLSPSQMSVAGSRAAYRYHAMSAVAGIADVDVQKNAPGKVAVTVLMDGGQMPGEDILQMVGNALSDDNVRPLTDEVMVQAPMAVSYTVNATYYISAGDTIDVAAIQERAQQAYEDYLVWQSAKLGRAINPDELRRRLLVAGAYRVIVALPDFVELEPSQVAVSVGSQLQYGGLI